MKKNNDSNISEKNNCQFSYLLSTNGIIGTEDQFTLLHELGVSCLQITFDGNEYINNKSNSFHCRGYEHLYNKS